MSSKIKHGWVPLEKENSTDHLDLNQMRPAIFPNLKPSTTSISLRLADSSLSELKTEANKRDIPYQSLMKMIVDDWLSARRKPPRKPSKRYRSSLKRVKK